jgi:glycosyltransferase involved in cell wall biosynthesis
MRVAHVVASYYPRIGGVETHVRQIAEACASTGDQVTVLTHATGAAPAQENLGGVRVLRFPETVRSVRYPLSLRLFRYLAAHVADFDVVHAHSYHTLVGHAAARSGLPFVFTPHYHGTGHTRAAALMHRFYRPAGAWVLASADAVICVSEAERDLMISDFLTVARKTWVIPNGTDSRAPLAARQRTGPPEPPLLLTVGRLERYKNVDLIIKAFGNMRTVADLVIVGDGPDRARLEGLARAVGRIRFAGRVSDAELGRLLTAATVVTSASDHEAFGLVVADGLMARARVVASAIPAHHEIGRLAGDDAPITYVDPRDTGAYAAALDAALAAGRVPPGRAWLPSWSEVATLTRSLYAAVVSRGATVVSREDAHDR